MNTTFKVQGTQAEHTVEVRDVRKFESVEAMMEFYKASDLTREKCQSWAPENGARFKTLGAATGWLKKLLKKHGWPEPRSWIVTQWQYDADKPVVIEIYLVRTRPPLKGFND